MNEKTITQSVTFKASPMDVYNLLMESKKHSLFTGEKAVISTKIGGKFSAYDGYITGKNLDLVPGKKIVQSWRASDWPPNHESKVTFIFTKTKTGTKLAFTHNDVPSEEVKNIKQGWIDFYWTPMKALLK